MAETNRPLEERTAMRPEDYRVMFEVEDEHWWFVGRRKIVFTQIARLLGMRQSKGGEPAEILDIGCGTGATLDALQNFGRAQGIDLSFLPLTFSRRRGHQRVICASATALPLADQTFDLVTALDVIEHIDDDLAGLREICRVLKPGAPAVFFVPAFMALWGPSDVQLGHFRRYRQASFRAVIEQAGLRVEKISYANTGLFVPIWLGRRIMTILGQTEAAELRMNHPWINRLLARIFGVEAGWLLDHRLPFGVSILCVARRPVE
jgi:SAM-dependent methyltransferase